MAPEVLGAASLPSALPGPTVSLLIPQVARERAGEGSGKQTPHVSARSREASKAQLLLLEISSHQSLPFRPAILLLLPRCTCRQEMEIPSQQIQSLDGHTGPVHVARYNHGAKYCLTGSSDRTIRLWNPALGKEIKKYEGHGREILALDISHDNAKFASSGGDKQVFVWDVASGATTRRLQGHFGKINAVAFNKDATVLCTAGFDAKIMIWDMRAAARDPLQTIKDASNSITSLSLPTPATGVGAEIISSSLDGHVRTHDLRMGKMTEDLVGSPVHCVLPSPQSPNDTYMAASADGKIRIFDRSNGGVLQTLEGHKVGEGRIRACWGYGESHILAGDDHGKIWAWDVLDGKAMNSNPPALHKKAITWLELSPNGKQMITASLDGTVKVWSK